MNYPEVGGIAQAIKLSIRAGTFWNTLPGSTKESLDQIATAMARMVAGDGVHWDAIIGYAHAAKPSTDDPNAVPPPVRRVGLEAIERSIREIPARNEAQ